MNVQQKTAECQGVIFGSGTNTSQWWGPVLDQGAKRLSRCSKLKNRLLEANGAIHADPPEQLQFLHSVMCQVGLPRKKTTARAFARRSGRVSILLEAGKLFDGTDFVDRPLPYGAIPRLILVHASTEAIRTRQRTIDVGDSMRQFLNTLGMQTNGGVRGGYTALRQQMESLAACRLTLGTYAAGRAVTVDAKPIKRFEAWLDRDANQRTLWPGALELSEEFFNALSEHAVPLDPRALATLKHSSLALDVYAWLAQRLCRIKPSGGTRLSWQALQEQFGQEYATAKNFKREFRHALGQAWSVYPDARLQLANGGLVLYPSPPPVRRTIISVGRPGGVL